MSANDGSSSDDDDDFHFDSANVGSKRYPVHDCCEFEDADSLKVSSRLLLDLNWSTSRQDPHPRGDYCLCVDPSIDFVYILSE